MDGLLKTGTILASESGNKYVVQKLLGAGGQGEVYDVENGGRHYALKWYFKNSATSEQKHILDNLIAKGSPDASFLWPEDLIYPSQGTSFGYIMALRPKNYKSIVDLMKRRVDPSFYTICRAAFNLTKGYQKLHAMGYSYRDISFGNMFFDPDNGDVLICDNDNVSVNGRDDSGVLGTPGFMAPEIVLGKAKPSRNTDLHSLAVLLFYMFMVNHPLNGRLEANIKCMDILAMERLYGTDPVFIFDPDDKRNRPVAGIHDNAKIYWDLYPEDFKELFTQVFTVGLKSPNRRVTENKWLEAIANLMSGIIICPNCGAEVFYDERKEQLGAAHICWGCSHTITVPAKLVIGKQKILLSAGTKLKSHHIYGDFDMDTAVGTVVQNPKNPSLWGIRNEDKVNWTYEKADGKQIPVAVGRSAGIAPGVKIHFGECVGAFM
ncbi:MAG: hypothetical protein LUD07_06295 [Clostridiales bacterium]|nr:hypothetical protein [Clostridiales bacterium]